jgi:hypothetical protein
VISSLRIDRTAFTSTAPIRTTRDAGGTGERSRVHAIAAAAIEMSTMHRLDTP